MAAGNFPLITFNRGRISPLGLARTDLDRVRLSAEVQTNWVPRALGSMSLRPGLGYLGSVYNDAAARILPFVFRATDTALIEVTSTAARVWIDDSVLTRAVSDAVITNGAFTTDLSGWTSADESGAASLWYSPGYMALTGTRYSRAIRRQQVTASARSHGLSVRVVRGKPFLRVGSSSGGDDYFSETQLRPGHYSLEITSTGSFYIELSANTEYASLVDSVLIESAGAMVLDSTWASVQLDQLRWQQSNDIVFCACSTSPQKRFERHTTRSWALTDYVSDDGPFRNVNVTATRLSPSALTGDISLQADRPVFQHDHVGALFQITSIGQTVEGVFTAGDQNSDYIRVTGVDDSRKFQIFVTTATAASPVWIQRSVGEPGSWQTVTSLKFTSSIDSTHDDGLDNSIVFYRLYTPTSYSTLNTAVAELSYGGGGITGQARITTVAAATESSAIVLKAFGATDPSELWSEGDWSGFRGYPSALSLHEGRIFWAGRSKLWGSVSDSFESFDTESTELGDSGPINLTIASGSNDSIQWLLSLTRLVMGTPLQEYQAKTSSLEEPLTPTNFALRDISTQGAAAVQAVKVDQRALFVQAAGTRVLEMTLEQGLLDYTTSDLTLLVPEIGEPQIVAIAAQRQPDTRVHFVRSDGTVAMLLTDPAENIRCWLDIETDGNIEEVAVLPGVPGDIESRVYYVVAREVNGSTRRYLERWATESQNRGGSSNRMADSFVVQDSTATTLVTGLSHLEGRSVVAWGSTDGLGTYTVSSGTITLSQASTYTCVGLGYSGLWRGSKLAYAAQAGSALTMRKRVNQLGLLLHDTHARGLQYGPSTDTLQYLPRMERGVAVSTAAVWSAYDSDPVVFPGHWDTDSRVVLYAQAPYPVTVLGLVVGLETKDKF